MKTDMVNGMLQIPWKVEIRKVETYSEDVQRDYLWKGWKRTIEAERRELEQSEE